MIMNKNDFHIGNLILQKLAEKERSVAWLAKKLPCDRSNFYKILKQPYIDVRLLQLISEALDYDFFAHYSHSLHLDQTEQ